MIDVADYIRRAAQRSGFKREYFLEKNIPTQPSSVLAIPFFGDLRSTFILSSLLLKTFKEKHKDKYIILCSWPGLKGLFPYVDEYWTIDDESTLKSLALEANNIYNGSGLAAEITKSLAEVVDVYTSRDLKTLWDGGFTKSYWDTFGEIKRFLPDVPSASMISPSFKTQCERMPGQKVVIHPGYKMRSWQSGKVLSLSVQKDFWIALVERLLAKGFAPVVYQNWFTYDLSREFADKCLYLVPKSVHDLLAAMRYIGCVLDVHTGFSRFALAARCPFVSVTERNIFMADKDYMIDDLCSEGLLRRYVFSFSTMLMAGSPEDWETSVIGNIIVKLGQVMSQGSVELPSTTESFVDVPYEMVRKRNAKRVGAAFITSSKKK